MSRSPQSRLMSVMLSTVVASAALVGWSRRRVEPSGAATTSGCSSPGSSATLSVKVNGFTRTVIVHVPKGSSDSTPLALVLNLHGSGTTALDQMLFSGMNKTANHDGFIVAYPQGLIADGTGFDWNIPGVPLIGGRAVPKGSANDVSFLTKLVGLLESRYCVNKDEVYATGFSGGAREASQLACDDSGIFAAVAPVSGLRRPDPVPPRARSPSSPFTARPIRSIPSTVTASRTGPTRCRARKRCGRNRTTVQRRHPRRRWPRPSNSRPTTSARTGRASSSTKWWARDTSGPAVPSCRRR